MDNLDFQTIDDYNFHIIDDPDLYISDDPDHDNPDFHIIDGVETIYEEDLESLKNKSVLVSSDDELQEIDDKIASDLNEDTITYFTKNWHR
ncbi:4880_t:CDS:1, partial [Scutellospora calospora]